MKPTLLPAILVLLAFVSALPAQTPPPAASRRPKQEKERRAADQRLEAWIEVLAGRIADAQPAIRRSAQEALRVLGSAAVPRLEQIARSGKAEAASAAERVLQRIRARRRSFESQTRRLGAALERLELKPSRLERARQALAAYSDRMKEISQQIMDGELERAQRRHAYGEAWKSLKETLTGVLGKAGYERFSREIWRGRWGSRKPKKRRDGGRRPTQKRDRGDG